MAEVPDYATERLERGLLRLPDHMRDSVRDWVLQAEPHPLSMGSFLRAVLENKFVEATAHADDDNTRHLRVWALFLYNDAPEACWGSAEKMTKWYRLHHGGKTSPPDDGDV